MKSSRTDDIALLLLRLSCGGLMALLHGSGKLAKALEGSTSFPDPLGIGAGTSLLLAALAEGVCGGMVALGLATRAALIALIITMGVAVFVHHGGDPVAKRELGLVYLMGYVALFLLGPGRLSASRLYIGKLQNRRILGWLLR